MKLKKQTAGEHTHQRVQAKHINHISHRPQYNHSLFFTKPARSHETVRDEFVTIDRMTSSPSHVTTLKQATAHTHTHTHTAKCTRLKTVTKDCPPLQRSVPLKQINQSSPIVLQNWQISLHASTSKPPRSSSQEHEMSPHWLRTVTHALGRMRV